MDTGIDYTHASFGGPGTPSAYAGNNPRIVEAGSFPTAKVIGGYDFAGTNYNASNPTAAIPAPDPDPLDENGHGTHVASIAAGLEVKEGSNVLVGAGVAPGASLYALKVFGASGSTDLVINALEWAMDPNGDGDLSDRVDVINMSLGSVWGVASADDPEQVALNLISSLGTVVVTSAGNEGNSSYITGAPAVADTAISVAATTTGSVTMPRVQYNNGTQQVPYQPANPFNSAITATLVDVDAVDGDAATGELCTTDGVIPGALTGAIALIQRGGGKECYFQTKINNAAALGAQGVIIYNHAAAADEFISMATGTATLPAGHTLRSYGLMLKGFHNTQVTVGPDSQPATFAWGDPDATASFTSRGPRGYDSKLKPELSAPGVLIYAAAIGSGKSGVSMSGTSMAAPHVTGVAALVRQAHPGWNPEKVKAALMSTAVDVGGEVPLTGAGRVDAEAAVFTRTLATGDANLVSLSWGVVQVGDTSSAYVAPEAKQVRLENLDATAHTYDVSVQFSDPQMTGATLGVPTSVTVPAGSTVGVPVTLTLNPALLPVAFDASMEEYYGFITFTPQGGGNTVRLPFYFVPRPYSTLSEISGAVKSISVVNNTDAQVTYTNTGPATASLWAWPALVIDGNEPEVNDMADLRAAGIDYVGSGSYGDMLGVGIAKWGSVHTLQPYFDETDLAIDTNRDGKTEYVLWNFNYGWFGGGDETNEWIVLLTDMTASSGQPSIFLASPYLIYGDFNSGLSEWYVPVGWIPLSRSDFGYQFFSYDSSGAMDSTPAGVFDYMRSPFVWGLSDFTPSTGAPVTLEVGLNDSAGFWLARPRGMMVVDYNGRPGTGQALIVPLGVEFYNSYLPVIAR
ncbi:S8 family serine peptidase [Anaerolinea thermolimosa]|uniref:S8 family serine peptidase n=1 Tax=Anaerolinea thermolimosa TaxID=229919 RepID=UPI0030844A10